MSLHHAIAQHITAATGEDFTVRSQHSIDGGSINAAYCLEGERRCYFVKVNQAARQDMFVAEAQGLGEIAASGTIRVPQPICTGATGDSAFLVLEHLELGGRDGQDRLGQGLAALHRAGGEHFGWHRDNTIGSTPQENSPAGDWPDFWRERRLGFQLELAVANGCSPYLRDRGAELMECFPALFSDHRPTPSLLHGDLWSGNYAITRDGEPVIFDPAVYYGDREADLAMTELFGGFSQDFYAAYQASWPLDPGYRTRKTLYNLYHILNHYNLFGGGYAAQAESMVDRLLSEVR